MMDGMSGWGFGFGGGIFMILWWVVILVAVVLVARWLLSLSTRGRADSSALDILSERYARGEITSEEYERMRREIGR